MKVKKIFRTPVFRVLLFLVFALLVAMGLHFRSPNIADSDSFYHFRHAAIYATDGIFTNAFPWLPFSPVSQYGSDIWYGFHVFLIPFTFFRDPVLGIKFAGVLITFLFLALAALSFKIFKAKGKFFWPFLALFAAPNTLFHIVMTRPHVLTSGLAMVLTAAVATQSGWGIFFASFFITFFHASFFWLSFFIAGVVAFFRSIFERRVNPVLSTLGWTALGTLAGFFLRPNPIGTIRIVYIQIFKLLFEKFKGLPLTFGKELFPLDWITVGKNFLPFMAITLIAGFFVYRKRRSRSDEVTVLESVSIYSAGVFFLAFFLMTMFMARRFYDLWVVFGILFVALAYTEIYNKNLTNFKKQKNQSAPIFLTYIVLFSLFTVPYSAVKHGLSMKTANDPLEFYESAHWLYIHAPPKAIVYNIYWDIFPKLFFWNPKSYYTSGMDPIFLYDYNPNMYWESYYLNTGLTTNSTCPEIACTAEMLEDTYNVLKNNFHASYVVVEKNRSQKFYAYALTDKRFILAFQNNLQAIFFAGSKNIRVTHRGNTRKC